MTIQARMTRATMDLDTDLDQAPEGTVKFEIGFSSELSMILPSYFLAC
jgi:hypothetical protein